MEILDIVKIFISPLFAKEGENLHSCFFIKLLTLPDSPLNDYLT